MLSLVLYGRNDSHGYNLHKRAAISLNCLAEVLDDEDDEIIFVDYNSQDLTPTFPEAISDTLTDKAKQKLRVIRVRPSYHRQFLGKTHLGCLEPQSRNIAVRRMNPKNRWILSTNTDMIFVPRKGGLSMTRALEDLAPSVYHLARFETPEFLWEEFDRKDAVTAIEAMRSWGTSLRLNEVVYGAPDNIYEAPGDFQLITREDYEALCGFDESMILGWHADSNFARRVMLYKGEIKSAGDRLFGYHCSHTRLPTLLHDSQRRQENSLTDYVRNVSAYAVKEQANGNWGAPGHQFEEIRLVRRRSIAKVLNASIPPGGPDMLEVTLRQETFDANDYDAGHVLPHLMNLLSQVRPNTKIMISGGDNELLEGVVNSFLALGANMIYLVPDGDAAEPPQRAGVDVRRMSRADAIAAADLFLIQNARASVSPQSLRADLEWRAQTILESIFDAERTRPFADHRLIVIVNGVHTRLKDTIEMNMSFSQMPYTTRIAHGVALDRTKYPGAEPVQPGRAFSAADRRLLGRLAKGIAEGEPQTGWERLADEIIAFAGSEADFIEGTGLPASAASHVVHSAQDAIKHAFREFPAEGQDLKGRRAAGQRLCSSADWDDPEWRQVAERYFGGSTVGELANRSRWTWERVTIACELRRLVSPASRPKLLLVTPGPDYAACVLTHMGYDVTYASVNAVLDRRPELAEWRGAFDHFNVLLPAAHRAWDGEVKPQGFDACVVTGAVLSTLNNEQSRQLGSAIETLCGRDKPVVASFLADLQDTPDGLLKASNVEAGFEAGGVFALAKFGGSMRSDWRVPRDTQLRYAPEDSTEPVCGLSYGYGGRHVTVGVMTALTGQRPSSLAALSHLLKEAPERLQRQPPARAIVQLPRDVTHLVSKLSQADSDTSYFFLAVNPGACRGVSVQFNGLKEDVIATIYVTQSGERFGPTPANGGDHSKVQFSDVPAGVPAMAGFAVPGQPDVLQVLLCGE